MKLKLTSTVPRHRAPDSTTTATSCSCRRHETCYRNKRKDKALIEMHLTSFDTIAERRFVLRLRGKSLEVCEVLLNLSLMSPFHHSTIAFRIYLMQREWCRIFSKAYKLSFHYKFVILFFLLSLKSTTKSVCVYI